MQKQMAHIVGVPKREPCEKCGNPVFLAERLTINKSVYHRTCLRCARCNSQLTPGSFYETENDGVFCCETCPDEEKKIQITPSETVSNGDVEEAFGAADPLRQSFREKLAMFQSNGKGLLQKSLSDEEKSKSLKRLSEMYTKNATEDPNLVREIETESRETHDSESDETSSDESENEDDVPPTLPKSQPPSLNAPLATDSPAKAKPQLPPKANVLNKIYGNTEKPFAVSKLKPPTNTDLTSATTQQQQEQSSTSTNESSLDINVHKSSQNQTLIENTNNGVDFKPPDKSHQSTVDESTINSDKIAANQLTNNNSFEINLNALDDNALSDALNDLTNVTKENEAAIVEGTLTRSNDCNDVHCMDNEHNKINSDDIEQQQPATAEREFNQANNDDDDIVELRSHSQVSAECEQNAAEDGSRQQQQHNKSIMNGGENSAENKSIDTNTDKRNSITLDNNSNAGDIGNSCSSSISNTSNNSSNVVRSRLSQFEALLQSADTRQTQQQTTHRCSDSPKLTSRNNNNNAIAVVSKSKPLEQNVATSCSSSSSNKTVTFDETQTALERNEQVPDRVNNPPELNENDSKEDDLHESLNSKNEQIATSYCESTEPDPVVAKPVPLKRATKTVNNEEEEDISPQPPTPVKRKQRQPASEAEKQKEEPVESLNVPEKIESLANGKQENNDANYPVDLNPFGSDDEEDETNNAAADVQLRTHENPTPKRKDSSNPFDSEDDEIELLKESTPRKLPSKFRVSTNPFGSDTEDEDDAESMSSKRTPVPTPRKPINGASFQFQSTPEPSPRMSYTLHPKMRLSGRVGDDIYGSDASLASASNYARPYDTMTKNNRIHGSMTSLASTPRHKKGRAPPAPKLNNSLTIMSAESSPMKASLSANSSPSHSVRATPLSRKKRPAPLPPTPKQMNSTDSKTNGSHSTRQTMFEDSFDSSINLDTSIESSYVSTAPSSSDFTTQSKPTEDTNSSIAEKTTSEINSSTVVEAPSSQRKRIPIDASLLDDLPPNSMTEMPSEENVVYRRTIVPSQIDASATNGAEEKTTNDRQWEKMKENKESQNKNRQSQVLLTALPVTIAVDDSNPLYSVNKSSYGKWKRRKGAAPPLPIPPRKVIQMLPLQEIRHELEVIEVQQQGLEKQGVMLEKMIRERCEGTEHENTPLNEFKPNSKEVEDLILQLFELVNEKNELFRRQAELMYLRRQHRLEQEQADIEYEIRVLMAQPECNKTDSDKAREEALISRLVEVVQLRNEVIESLEMDRLREAEEDQSIKARLELHTARRDEELCQQTPTKLSKKEKKKQKESKKLAKQKKMDADKDADESEINQLDKSKEKKKKKKFLF